MQDEATAYRELRASYFYDGYCVLTEVYPTPGQVAMCWGVLLKKAHLESLLSLVPLMYRV